jgi:hypothetical protein
MRVPVLATSGIDVSFPVAGKSDAESELGLRASSVGSEKFLEAGRMGDEPDCHPELASKFKED